MIDKYTKLDNKITEFVFKPYFNTIKGEIK